MVKALSPSKLRTFPVDERMSQTRRAPTRRHQSRGLWAALGALLLTIGFRGAEELTEEHEFSSIDGGHQGTASSASGEPDGEGGAGPSGAPLMTGGEDAPILCKSDDPLDILFLGNSYTHYFDMPTLLEGIADSAGCRINAEMVAPGGSGLNLHAENGTTLTAIASRKWDAVVLQNFSQHPSQPVEAVRVKTFPSVKTLVDSIRANDPQTKIYYYVTWGRRDGDIQNCNRNKMVCTFDGHTEALHRGYSMYAEEFGGDLVDVGGAFAKIYRDERAPFSARQLYDRDGSHPSLRGSYLAASVFFAALYRTSPVGLSYPEDLTEEAARYIQRVAGSLPVSGA